MIEKTCPCKNPCCLVLASERAGTLLTDKPASDASLSLATVQEQGMYSAADTGRSVPRSAPSPSVVSITRRQIQTKASSGCTRQRHPQPGIVATMRASQSPRYASRAPHHHPCAPVVHHLQPTRRSPRSRSNRVPSALPTLAAGQHPKRAVRGSAAHPQRLSRPTRFYRLVTTRTSFQYPSQCRVLVCPRWLSRSASLALAVCKYVIPVVS